MPLVTGGGAQAQIGWVSVAMIDGVYRDAACEGERGLLWNRNVCNWVNLHGQVILAGLALLCVCLILYSADRDALQGKVYKKMLQLAQGLPRPWNLEGGRPVDEQPSALAYYIKHWAVYPRREEFEAVRPVYGPVRPQEARLAERNHAHLAQAQTSASARPHNQNENENNSRSNYNSK